MPIALLIEGWGRLCRGLESAGRGDLAGGFSANTSSYQALMEDHMKFRPLHDRVVVKRIDAEEKTAGGIIIPDTAQGEAAAGRRSSPSAPAAVTRAAS